MPGKKSFDSIEKTVEWLTTNQETFVELTLESETFLTADERKRLYQSHNGIVHLIPKVKIRNWMKPSFVILISIRISSLCSEIILNLKTLARMPMKSSSICLTKFLTLRAYDSNSANFRRYLFLPGTSENRFWKSYGSRTFGIFGAVGSGKSSILEAISFALYGETERLNARDRRTYNMMNLKSNRSYIEFDFINSENKNTARHVNLKGILKFWRCKTPSVTFYEWKNNNWIPLDHSNAEQIVGLSYANFKRTIIIPQGQFKEFLELGAADRTNMMKEIFGLQRFDLQNNVSLINSKTAQNLISWKDNWKGLKR